MFKRRTKIHFEFSAGQTSNFLILSMNKDLKSTSFTRVKTRARGYHFIKHYFCRQWYKKTEENSKINSRP